MLIKDKVYVNFKIKEPILNMEELNDSENVLLKKKFRYVDPEILVKGKIISLSSISKKTKN